MSVAVRPSLERPPDFDAALPPDFDAVRPPLFFLVFLVAMLFAGSGTDVAR
jgi:hypothetical protein